MRFLSYHKRIEGFPWEFCYLILREKSIYQMCSSKHNFYLVISWIMHLKR